MEFHAPQKGAGGYLADIGTELKQGNMGPAKVLPFHIDGMGYSRNAHLSAFFTAGDAVSYFWGDLSLPVHASLQ
jgi:hypothetical protein